MVYPSLQNLDSLDCWLLVDPGKLLEHIKRLKLSLISYECLFSVRKFYTTELRLISVRRYGPYGFKLHNWSHLWLLFSDSSHFTIELLSVCIIHRSLLLKDFFGFDAFEHNLLNHSWVVIFFLVSKVLKLKSAYIDSRVRDHHQALGLHYLLVDDLRESVWLLLDNLQIPYRVVVHHLMLLFVSRNPRKLLCNSRNQ